MAKDYEEIPMVEKGKDGKLILNMCDNELNDDWIRSARLDPDSEEAKERERGKMVRALTEKEGDQ
jgi:hypothetical protein